MVRKSHLKQVPKASRPYMPGYGMMFEKGKRSLPWTWAADYLAKAHNYWVATARSDGRPHVMPVWGVWLDGSFWFRTGRRSRKSRNIVANPNCVVCPENAAEALILEGSAREVKNSSLLQRFANAYKRKYNWDMSKSQDPVYAVQPKVAFGFIEKPGTVSANPTRWLFSGAG